MDQSAAGTVTHLTDRASRQRVITKAWNTSVDALGFLTALEKTGYILAHDDKHSYIVVDPAGKSFSLTRQIEGTKAKDIRARLATLRPDQLPHIRIAVERANITDIKSSPTLEIANCRSAALIIAPYVLLILSVLLVYANVYHNDFLYDDLFLIRYNHFLTSWRYIGIL